MAPPGADVDLVDVDGADVGVEIMPGGHPVLVAPVVIVQINEAAGVVGPELTEEAEGVGLHPPQVIRPPHGVLVGGVTVLRYIFPKLVLAQAQFPGAVVLLLHGGRTFVPVVKRSHQRHVFGVGSPYAEMPFALVALVAWMCAEHFIGTAVRALMKGIADFSRWRMIQHRNFLLTAKICVSKHILFERSMVIVFGEQPFRQVHFRRFFKNFIRKISSLTFETESPKGI